MNLFLGANQKKKVGMMTIIDVALYCVTVNKDAKMIKLIILDFSLTDNNLFSQFIRVPSSACEHTTFLNF